MSLLTTVQEAMAQIVRAEPRDPDVAVTTCCMYPTNAFVRVVVRGGTNAFTVSDEGGGFGDVENAGVTARMTDGMVKHIVSPQGLKIDNGIITSPSVTRDALPVAIFLVANASKEVAEWFYATLKIKRERNFKQLVRRFLDETFTQNVKHDLEIVGKSNKTHSFENVVLLANGRKLIVDPVLHDHASINARIVANVDVANMSHEGIEQRIVYDDSEEWKADELNLLTVGAPIVAFSKSPDVIRRVAAP